MYISVVIPLFRCEHYIEELTSRLHDSLVKISETYEIVFVNDFSPLADWEMVKRECDKSSRVKGIDLSRNFGQHIAITAGLEECTGEWIVVMDGDLQDQPEEILKLHMVAVRGFDVVLGQRLIREDSFFKKMSSGIFYFIFSYLTSTKQDSSVGNFGIYHKKVIEAVLSMGDVTRYFPAMVQWVGFKSSKVAINHAKRQNGSTSYSIKKLFDLAFDNIISFSEKPLRLTVKFGFLLSLISAAIGGIYISIYLLGEIKVSGFASVIISIWFLSGIIISILGILGLYVGKVFQKVKNRPIYVVNEKLNL